MDERIRLVQKPNGATEIRVSEDTLNEIGKYGLAAELESRDFHPEHLGTPVHYPLRREWRIPVRRAQ